MERLGPLSHVHLCWSQRVSRSQPLHTATLICHLEIYFSKGLTFKAFHFVGQQGVWEVDHLSFARNQAMSWLMVCQSLRALLALKESLVTATMQLNIVLTSGQ